MGRPGALSCSFVALERKSLPVTGCFGSVASEQAIMRGSGRMIAPVSAADNCHFARAYRARVQNHTAAPVATKPASDSAFSVSPSTAYAISTVTPGIR